ncbi:probable carboxylesterase 12 [Cornus florida]|uniref:probable carboxylesterase 12 n=1 Tax=Cornus florida TaxID=4283 RepID=UPI00289A9E49|nr:probable carboxylesterase 12 [Cornus florida]
MDPNTTTTEVAYQFLPYFRAYKNGTVERFFGTDIVPTSTDLQAGVSSKDVLIVPETGVSARLFMPATISSTTTNHVKHPLLLYFHGGAFCFGSPFCSTYHNYLTSLVAKANVVAVSVDYRLAPEHPLPAAYEDSFDVLKWVVSHYNGLGPEEWLNHGVDFGRVFVAGDSAGASIAHSVALQAGVEDLGLGGVKLLGACFVHPDFASKEEGPTGAWFFACPITIGSDDPRINPGIDPRLPKLGCSRVLVCVAEKDGLRRRGWHYYETLGKSGWDGVVDILETQGEDHVFHLFNPTCANAVALLERLASFMNQA